jgi:hypothetical protein
MSPFPVELSLEIQPGARFDLIDVREQAAAHRETLERYPHALYCSFHTTAGYLEQSLASRLTHARLGIGPYIHLFQTLFPEGAGYRHDELDLREELSADQRTVEPRNADAHLAFIAAGSRASWRSTRRRSSPASRSAYRCRGIRWIR